jgi:hypothetical protein
MAMYATSAAAIAARAIRRTDGFSTLHFYSAVPR